MTSRRSGWAAGLAQAPSSLGTRFLARGVVAAAVLICAPVLAQTPSRDAPQSLALPSMPGSSPAVQQGPNPTAQERLAYETAFKATLDKPSDPETLARFAGLAVQVGDIEGAISALERLLLIEGDQPEVKLELGVLYFRLGSREAAAAYLEAARSAPDASKETRDRAETFLKAIGR
jgi:Flp pilus assembly protein TadD